MRALRAGLRHRGRCRTQRRCHGRRPLPVRCRRRYRCRQGRPRRGRGRRRAQGGDVTLNFVDTDIREIARVVLGETLKLNYTIDAGVQGTATLEISKPVPRSTLLSLVESLLNQNGATLVERDGIYRVTPAG